MIEDDKICNELKALSEILSIYSYIINLFITRKLNLPISYGTIISHGFLGTKCAHGFVSGLRHVIKRFV